MDYNRGLIKQIEDLTIEKESLKRSNSKLREDNRGLRSESAYLRKSVESKIEAAVERQVTPLRQKISELEAMIASKDLEIQRLKAVINKDSTNSSKPPGADGFKIIPNNRENMPTLKYTARMAYASMKQVPMQVLKNTCTTHRRISIADLLP